MNSIYLEDVGRKIGAHWAIRGADFEIMRGDVFGIFGGAGSGKTSLIDLIAGKIEPDEGAVVFGGDDAGVLVSLAGQKLGLAEDLSVVENLQLFASLWKVKRRSRQSRISMFLQLLGLADVRSRRVGELSPGQSAAVEIAKALVPTADVYVIDGLIERLDSSVRRRVWEYILSRRRHGETFVIGTSSGREASMCDRVAVLVRGSVVFVGKPKELVSDSRGEVVTVEAMNAPVLRSQIGERFGAVVIEKEGMLEIRDCDASKEAVEILSKAASDVSCLYLRYPTLDDALEELERR